VLIAAVIALCIVLFLLALVAPRLSRGPERASHRVFGAGSRGASKAPGPLGRWLAKPFRKSSSAVGSSAEKGRETRSKLPF
jgi:uncharacterized protein DUF6411